MFHCNSNTNNNNEIYSASLVTNCPRMRYIVLYNSEHKLLDIVDAESSRHLKCVATRQRCEYVIRKETVSHQLPTCLT